MRYDLHAAERTGTEEPRATTGGASGFCLPADHGCTPGQKGRARLTNPTQPPHPCFVIHSHRPYCFDFNVILALPAGFRYRNRFDLQWVDPSLRQDVASLAGQRVLLVLRDIEENRLIPVRWALLLSAQMVGQISYFEYVLDNLIQYSTAQNVRLQEIIDRTASFSANHSWLPGSAGQNLVGASVFMTKVGYGLPTADASDLTAWGNAVSAVATAQIFERIEFLKIVGLEGASGQPAPVEEECFRVSPGAVYTLRVFQHVPRPGSQPIPQHGIELNSFPSQVTALRSRQQAVGKYDMLTFIIKIRPLEPGDRTSLEIPHIPDAALGGSSITSLYLPLAVRRPGLARLISVFLILIVSLLFMFRPGLLSLPKDVVRNIATILFVITLAGPSRTISGIWPSWPWRFER